MLVDVDTFGDGDDKYLALANEEYGRQLTIGSTWTRLRVGIFAAVEPDSTNNLTSCSLRLGISKAKTDHAGSNAAAHWYGMNWFGNAVSLAGATLTYTAASGNPHYRGVGGTRMQILNTVIAGANGAGGPALPVAEVGVVRRWPLLVEFKKSGTTLIVSTAAINNPLDATSALNYSLNQFLDQMLNPVDMSSASVPSIGSTALSPLGSSTFASYPTNVATYGEVIAPQIGWNKLTQKLRIYALAVSRLE